MSSVFTARNGEVDLCVEAFGDPASEPLVLVMGATASMLWWPDELIDALVEERYYVVRFDHRDTGQSTTFPPGSTPYSIHEMADDVLAVMDRCGLAEAHLVGMSLGGLLCQLIALRNGERVRSLTLIASEIFATPETEIRPIDRAILEHVGKLSEIDWESEESAVGFLARLGELSARGDRVLDHDRFLQRARREFARARQLPSMLNHAGLSGNSPWHGRIDEIRQPVLVLHGNRDIAVDPAHAEAIARTAPFARLMLLEGAGHDLHPDDIPLIVAEISKHTME